MLFEHKSINELNLHVFWPIQQQDPELMACWIDLGNQKKQHPFFVQRLPVKACRVLHPEKLYFFQFVMRDTQKDGATHCILGKSTCRPQIYCVCMGI